MQSDIDIIKGKARKSIQYIQDACKSNYQHYLGILQTCYYGNARDNIIRENGASGGCVTAIVKTYLQTQFNAQALLVNNNEYQIFGNMFKLPQGSIYDLRTNIIKRPIPSKAIIVCLPCQVKFFRSITSEATIIGLFCSHRIITKGIKEIVGNNEFIYRYKYNNNTGLKYGNKFIPLKTYWSKYLNYVYIPKDCLKCKDATAELADISIGDAHGHKEFGIGKNIIIVRTDSGKILFNNAVESGSIEIEETNPTSIINSHIYIRIKKDSKELKIIIYKILRKVGFYITYWKIKPVLKIWTWYIKRQGIEINE